MNFQKQLLINFWVLKQNSMLFRVKYIYLIHLKTTTQHLTEKFAQMLYRDAWCHNSVQMYTLISAQERWVWEGNNKQARVLEHNFPKEILPISSDTTIPIPSEHVYRVCTKLITDLSLHASVPPPQTFLGHFYVCWFYNKVRLKNS